MAAKWQMADMMRKSVEEREIFRGMDKFRQVKI
jgi:hypothetical protein